MFALLFSCENTDTTYQQYVSNFPYNLKNPDLEVKLPRALTETSALSLSSDSTQLLTLNDEEGKIFFLNKSNGSVSKEIRFGKKGDYEGIELV
ncbi:MAG: hypothetical protein AAFO82_07780, partial [Bacteroidota bacterium]